MKHYQEEPDSSFTHHGQLHNLNILFKEVENTPPKRIDLADVVWILEDAVVDPKRVKAADVHVPILVVHEHHPDLWIVVDGTHRVKRAVELGLESLPCKIVTEQQLQKAKVPNMPSATVKRFAEESGKTVEEVEALWSDCKTAASKKFKQGEKDDGYWPYVTACTRNKLGLKKPVTESILEKWVKDSDR